MSEAKFHLVARASILASGATDDFHHVAPDEVVLVSVEALERVTRERDEETRKRYGAERERDEARADAALLRIALENAEPIEAERDLLRAEVERLRAMGEKVNAIRNSIVGTQALNWSEHAYPLVAALDEAGFVGMSYPEGREHFGTLIERTVKAEAEVERLRGALEDVSLWLSHWRHAIVIRAEGAAQAWDELERIHNKAASFSARGEVRR